LAENALDRADGNPIDPGDLEIQIQIRISGSANHCSHADKRVAKLTNARLEERMITILDLKAEFAKLTMLKGRSPTTPDAERKEAITRLAPYRDGAIFTAKFSGTSAWERHPQGDEIVQIVDGATILHLMTDEGRQSLSLKAGMMAIVPQNMWHQFDASEGVCVMTATPQPTEHLRFDVDDPRTAGEGRVKARPRCNSKSSR
jgi:quercetin dioxygenase-like cupin family protein